MPCYHPLQGWYSCDGEDKGKVIFARQPGRMYIETPLPCGKCVGCRMENARQWAIRCMHEAETHDDNCVVTLTYDDTHLPIDGGLRPDDLQLWLKRLRKQFADRRIRFFACGEYGSQLQRPHYHVLLFGIDFMDDICYHVNSELPPVADLQETWPNGYVKVTPFSYNSAAYVARYVLKKQTNEYSGKEVVNRATGEVLPAEFTRMSRGRGKITGIGSGWISVNDQDTYKDDTVVFARGQVTRPPRYYDKKFIEKNGESSLDILKRKRIEGSFTRRADNTPARLSVREKVMKAKLALQKRGYENG